LNAFARTFSPARGTIFKGDKVNVPTSEPKAIAAADAKAGREARIAFTVARKAKK